MTLKKTTKKRERKRIIDSFDLFDVPEIEQAEILEALNDKRWDWYKDCDGCTAVDEDGWLTKYYPPCVRHDYDCWFGHNVHTSTKRFTRLNKIYGMKTWKYRGRHIGVYVAWYAWFKWRNMIWGAPGNRNAEQCKNWKFFIDTETEDLKKEFQKLSITLGVSVKEAEKIFIKNLLQSWALIERLAVCQKCNLHHNCKVLKIWQERLKKK